jgi:hypothetical protein
MFFSHLQVLAHAVAVQAKRTPAQRLSAARLRRARRSDAACHRVLPVELR